MLLEALIARRTRLTLPQLVLFFRPEPTVYAPFAQVVTIHKGTCCARTYGGGGSGSGHCGGGGGGYGRSRRLIRWSLGWFHSWPAFNHRKACTSERLGQNSVLTSVSCNAETSFRLISSSPTKRNVKRKNIHHKPKASGKSDHLELLVSSF